MIQPVSVGEPPLNGEVGDLRIRLHDAHSIVLAEKHVGESFKIKSLRLRSVSRKNIAKMCFGWSPTKHHIYPYLHLRSYE